MNQCCVCLLHEPCLRGRWALAGCAVHGEGSHWPPRNLTTSPASHLAGHTPASMHEVKHLLVQQLWSTLDGSFWTHQLTSRKCCSKWRSCKHCSILVQWCSQKSSKAVSVSSSWPRSLRRARDGGQNVIQNEYICTEIFHYSSSFWMHIYIYFFLFTSAQ